VADAPLLVARRGAVLVLTLNRPEVRNAIDVPMAEAIAAALAELDADPTLAVGVLTGEGKGFCAGMDLAAFAETGNRPWAGEGGFAGIVRKPPATPLIAALEGFAVAGGFEIALACDLIVAAEGTKLGLPETKRGLVAAGGALRRLPRRLPAGLAMELALTGELTTADRVTPWAASSASSRGAAPSAQPSSSRSRSPRTARSRWPPRSPCSSSSGPGAMTTSSSSRPGSSIR